MTLTNQFRADYLEKQIKRYGATKLSDRELFGLLLSQFCAPRKVPQLTNQFFTENFDLTHISYLTATDWERYFNNQTKAIRMQVVCEFVKRCRQRPPLVLGQVGSSQMIGNHLIEKLKFNRQEVLYGVLLDTKNQIIHEKKIFKGTLDSATVHPREIFQLAIQFTAARIIIAHNHPSGKPEPSKNDQLLTDRLVKCGELLGIELLDHIIIGKNNYFSFREAQLI